MDAAKKVVVDELHAPVRKNFPRRKVVIRGIDETWQADLVDMQKYSRMNEGFNYILTVIDNVSKYAWALPLKTKTGEELSKAFKKIFQEGRIPQKIHVDQGTEFYNASVKNLLAEKSIHLYSTFSEKKASICERFNRTLKTNMWKLFSLNGNYKWVDILQTLISKYNNTVHRSIGMKPIRVTEADEERLVNLLNKTNLRNKKPKFKIGDQVRISKNKTIFEKGYTPNWGTEIFTIIKVQKTRPTTYKIRDYQGQNIEGGFYEFELLKAKKPDIFLIEKILQRRGNQIRVKWLGFDDSHNQWIDKSDL